MGGNKGHDNGNDPPASKVTSPVDVERASGNISERERGVEVAAIAIAAAMEEMGASSAKQHEHSSSKRSNTKSHSKKKKKEVSFKPPLTRGTTHARQRRSHRYDNDDNDNNRNTRSLVGEANMLLKMEQDRDDGSHFDSSKRSSKQKRDVFDRDAKSLMTRQYYEALVDTEIEETAIDVAIDSAIGDLTGVACDCSLLKDNAFVRQYLRAKEAWFPDIQSKANTIHRASRLSHVEARERENWMLLNLDLIDVQTSMKNRTPQPLTVTPHMAHTIRQLPQKDVTLYLKLDEDMPKHSCTAYRVDTGRFENGETTKLFRYFRICALQQNKDSKRNRHHNIIATVASACLHPYTTATGGTLLPNPDQQHQQQQLHAFRPSHILLDEACDAHSIELQKTLHTTLGIPECRLVDPLLRELHEDSDLDFFHDEDEVVTGDHATVAAEEEPRGVEEESRDDHQVNAILSVEDDWGVQEMLGDCDNASLIEIASILSDKDSTGFCGGGACFQPFTGGGRVIQNGC